MNTAEVVMAAATLVAAVVSIVAVVVAARSASAAEKSADVAAKALHRGAVRELIGACHELVAEELRVQSLANDLRADYTALAVFTGGVGGNAEKQVKGKVEDNAKLAAEHSKEGRALVEDPTRLIEASDEDLDQMHARIEAARGVIRNIKEEMARDLEHVRTQNQMYREKRTR